MESLIAFLYTLKELSQDFENCEIKSTSLRILGFERYINLCLNKETYFNKLAHLKG